MIDTSKEIKDLQLKIWLEKSPMERLHQLLTDNEALFKFWKEVKQIQKNNAVSNETIITHLNNNSIIKKL